MQTCPTPTLPWIFISLLSIFSGVSQAQERISGPLGITFIKAPAGEFIMGTPDLVEVLFEMEDPKESAIEDEQPAHKVVFAKPFYLSQTEVTQGQWLQLMGTKPGPKRHWNHPQWQQIPIMSVSWNEVQAFMAKLNAQDPGHNYQLPTEAQWEYAAKAGVSGLRHFDDEPLEDYAWFIENSGDVPHPVAQKKPNPWGFYDMYGNAWEWVADWYSADYYAHSAQVDPAGPSTRVNRTRRGGSYHCKRHMVRSGYRAADTPNTAYSVLGFRLKMDNL